MKANLTQSSLNNLPDCLLCPATRVAGFAIAGNRVFSLTPMKALLNYTQAITDLIAERAKHGEAITVMWAN